MLFKLKLKDSNGSDIQVAEREYVLQSAGFLATLSSSFSLWSLLIGMAGGLSVILFMRRPRPTRKSPPHPVEYMAKKQL